jgi:hypothetical protein
MQIGCLAPFLFDATSMEKKYRLTSLALTRIRRLPLERKLELASTLQRLGYLGGTSVADHWKADHVSVGVALAILREVTGLIDDKIIEEVK